MAQLEEADTVDPGGGFVTRTKNFVMAKKKELRPWATFFSIKKMKKPKGISEATSRLYHNVSIYINITPAASYRTHATCTFGNKNKNVHTLEHRYVLHNHSSL